MANNYKILFNLFQEHLHVGEDKTWAGNLNQSI